MSSKKEYVYCIWAHSKVNGPSPYIYRMVATSKADVKRKWAESFYWHLTIDHIEKADITPEYLNRPYDFAVSKAVLLGLKSGPSSFQPPYNTTVVMNHDRIKPRKPEMNFAISFMQYHLPFC